jgi:pyruvate-formate lyase-activating enzyme
LALIVPYAYRSEGFFSDTLLGVLCQMSREQGHRAELARVYYEGDPQGDLAVASLLERWLDELAPDLIAVERLFDPAPLQAYCSRGPSRRVLLVSSGDPCSDLTGIDLVVGAAASVENGSRRTPAALEIAAAFSGILGAMASGTDPGELPGVARVREGRLLPPVNPNRAPQAPFAIRPALDHRDIALGPAPRVVRKTLLGNAGCPYGRDALEGAHFAGVEPPADAGVSRRGCSFCFMGGDYDPKPPDRAAAELADQAVWITRGAPEIEELVISDQHPLPHLAQALRLARERGARPVRWLFATRPDAFLRNRREVDEAITAAEATGQIIEAYLVGFEAFSDAALARYNKGLTVADQLAAIASMRELAALHPAAFAYARSQGHSLILWSPWTTPEELAECVAVIRRHGLCELFSELGGNSLRLYRELPVTWAAARDGALASEWEGPPPSSRGYSRGLPWRFLDPRARLAFAVARALRQDLGRETETAQLGAAAALAGAAPSGARDAEAVREVRRGLAALCAALGTVDRARRPEPMFGCCEEEVAPVLFAGACNDGCPHCPERDTWLPDDREALLARIDAAQETGRTALFAGREPTVHPHFFDLLEHASRGQRRVGLATNGRRFAYAAFARRAAPHLAGAGVKLHAPDPASADRIAHAPGAHAQAVAGARALRSLGVPVEIRAPLHRDNLASFENHLPLARACGASQIRIEASLDAIGLDRLEEAAAAVAALARRCEEARFPLRASPVAGARGRFNRLELRSDLETHARSSLAHGGEPAEERS